MTVYICTGLKYTPSNYGQENNSILFGPSKDSIFYYVVLLYLNHMLALPVSCISESRIKIIFNLNFYFHTSLWFVVRQKVLLNLLKHHKRSVKIKI